MQLDNTSIAIRERGLLDTLDLSVHVFRAYAKPLLVTLGMGAAPLMVFNYFLLDWQAELADPETGFPFRFVWHMTWQVILAAPLASLFATRYLSQVVFVERPRYRDVARSVAQAWPQILLCQVLLRGTGLAWLVELSLDRTQEFDGFHEGFLLFAIAAYALAVRAFRPFLSEIILLERNPLWSRKERVLTVRRRSAMLHGTNSGDLLLHWMAAALIGTCLTLACYGICLFIAGFFLNDWSQSPFMVRFCLPLSMWLVTGYLTVFRFLSYLDLRIRQEGWEVELRLRAESARLKTSYGA